MLGKPKQFVPGRCRVHGLAGDPMHIRGTIFIDFFRCAHIQPKNRGTNWLVLLVKAYKGLALMSDGYSGDQFGRQRLRGCFCYRRRNGVPPVAGILLAPAGFGCCTSNPLRPSAIALPLSSQTTAFAAEVEQSTLITSLPVMLVS